MAVERVYNNICSHTHAGARIRIVYGLLKAYGHCSFCFRSEFSIGSFFRAPGVLNRNYNSNVISEHNVGKFIHLIALCTVFETKARVIIFTHCLPIDDVSTASIKVRAIVTMKMNSFIQDFNSCP